MLLFTKKNFTSVCDSLAATDADLRLVIEQYGYPPLWKRAASFETLIHIILEQQVSLASALAALNKLKEKIVDKKQKAHSSVPPFEYVLSWTEWL